MKTGIELIAEEQQRKKEVYGYDVTNPENAEFYSEGELVDAAMQYLGSDLISCYPENWTHPYKPDGLNRIRELQKAGAFIADEIDRLQNQKEANNE